ncbi:MAG: biopolymer transporter ExbD [Bdellovibrionales bacterium]|nr:biopolymer transporter ExbD [Bdellovibrionales bacterium]
MASKISIDRNGDDLPSISEINVTPFVDVVLVLLVIFMVTAPMLVREQMNVNLPKTETGEKSASESLSITLDKAGKIFLTGKEINFATLESTVKEMAQKNPQMQTVISADQETHHGDVVKVMDLVKKLGLTRFAIQIERR